MSSRENVEIRGLGWGMYIIDDDSPGKYMLTKYCCDDGSVSDGKLYLQFGDY